MSVTTTEQLVALLEKSNLLTNEQLDSVRADFAITADDQLFSLIEAMADREWLTHWQGKMLLSGYHTFFLGKYKLLDHLGEGGMGSVFKAEQTPLGRLVAIKTVRKDLVGRKELVARFRREIQAAAALNHPNIVAAYDADSVAGRHFLVMEYVEGRDLGAMIKQGRKLPIGAACEYIRQAALGLQHAHDRQMVHRDIKPSNLLLDTAGRVKILDMGLARIVQGSEKEQTDLTHTGQVVGTPDYISPEQARDTKSADIRSDIYSLGCSLYRLVTGKVPYQGDGAIAKITARLTDDTPLLRSRLPEAPTELEAVLLKMMARETNQRYQTPADVVQALTPFADATTDVPVSQEQSSAKDAAVAPTVAAPVAPELNDFLNQLAEAAARDEEVDTGTLAVEKTEAGSHSIDRSALTQKYDPEAVSPDTSRTPKISRAGRKLQAEMAARKQADKRRLRIILSAVVAFLAVVGGLVAWQQAGETHLVVDLGEIKLKSATLEVDGRPRSLVKAGSYEYRGRPGTYRLTLVREGHEPIETTLKFRRGQTRTFRPDWKPNADTARRLRLADFTQRVDRLVALPGEGAGVQASPDNPSVVTLRGELTNFRSQHSTTSEALGAAKQMARLPWPIDKLKREQIDPNQLKIAGQGDAARAPKELVAILGDVRMNHWWVVWSVAFSPDGRTLASGSMDATIKLWEMATGKELQTLTDHTGSIWSVAYSADGQMLACGGRDTTITLWETVTGKELQTLTGHTEPVTSVAFSPDGRTLATGSQDNTIKLWETATGKELHTLTSHTDRVWSVAFSFDGRTLATGGSDDTIKLWETATGKELQTLTGHTTNVRSVAFSPDGRTLATGGEDNTAKLWETSSGKELRTLTGHADWVLSVTFSPDGRTLVTGSRDRTIKLWETATGKERQTLTGHADRVNSVTFNPDGKTLASGSSDRTIKLWDTAMGKERRALSGHTRKVSSVVFSRDGRMLSTDSKDNAIHLRGAVAEDERLVLTGHTDRVLSATFSPDHRMLASGSEDKTIKLWETATGKELQTLTGHSDRVLRVAFSPDGQMLVSGSEDKTIKLWETATGKELQTLTGHSDRVLSVAFSRDGQTLASQSEDNTMKLWETTTGRELLTLSGQSGRAPSIRFSPNGITLATVAGDDGTIKLWETTTGKELRTLTGHTARVKHVRFSRDGRTLATASSDYTTKLWETATGKELQTLTGHLDVVERVAFSPDGRTLATCSRDHAIKLWEIATGKELRTLTGHADWVLSVTFSPDGRTLVTGSRDGTARLWDLNANDESLLKTFTLAPAGAPVSRIGFTPDGRHLVATNTNGTVYVLRLKELAVK